MQDIVATLIERSSTAGEIDERRFIREQGLLPPETRAIVRADPALAYRLFGVPHLERLGTDYHFWDNTTLSLKEPLAAHVRDGARVLEIGPGPSATLSLHLHHTKKDLRIVCAEVHPPFLASAARAVALSDAPITIVESDMTSGVTGEFDVIFMNPPYVKPAALDAFAIRPGMSEHQAGHGGADGSEVAARFVAEVPASLAPGGVALLGVNNRHLEDERVLELIDGSPLRLIRKHYADEDVPPYSQVYVLGRR